LGSSTKVALTDSITFRELSDNCDMTFTSFACQALYSPRSELKTFMEPTAFRSLARITF